MGFDHRVTVASIALVLATGACKKPPPPSPAVLGSSSAPKPKAVDEIDPGELAEGPLDVFGLHLPRKFTLVGQVNDVAYAQGEAKMEDVSNYVRQRVLAKHVEVGPDKTIFTGATMKNGGSGRILDITVQLIQLRTKIMIRDVTPTPSDGASQDEQLRRVGLKPDGTLLDPTHLR